jgi:uncharacterized glyoxalase superfamily protein PhnB
MSQSILGPAIPQLPTGDIEKTAKYFSEKLGFEIVAQYKEQNFLIVKRGAAEIHFWQAPSEKEARDLASESSCYIRVDNIEALFAELRKRGATFRYELTKQPWGMHEMQIDDPYMNAIRFGEPLC